MCICTVQYLIFNSLTLDLEVYEAHLKAAFGIRWWAGLQGTTSFFNQSETRLAHSNANQRRRTDWLPDR